AGPRPMLLESTRVRWIRLEAAAWTAFMGVPGLLLTILTLGAVGLSRTGDGPGATSVFVVLLPAGIATAATAGGVWLMMRGLDRRVRYSFCLVVAAGQHLASSLSVIVPDQLSGGMARQNTLAALVLVVASGFLGGLLFGQGATPTRPA